MKRLLGVYVIQIPEYRGLADEALRGYGVVD